MLSSRRRRGSVLVLALWVLVFFGAMVAALGARMNSQVSTIRRLTESTAERIRAYSGVGYVLGIVRDTVEAGKEPQALPASFWRSNEKVFRDVLLFDGSAETFSVSYGSVQAPTYGLSDEESRININHATEEVFRRIYGSIDEFTGDDADRLAKETLKYLEEHGRFASVEELAMVPGISDEIVAKLKEHLTIFGEGRVNLNTVSRETLRVLGIDLSLANRIVEYRESASTQEEFLDAQSAPEDAFKDLGDLTQKVGISPGENTQLQNIGSLWTGASSTFRFSSRVISKDGRIRAGFECVVNRRGEILFLANA